MLLRYNVRIWLVKWLRKRNPQKTTKILTWTKKCALQSKKEKKKNYSRTLNRIFFYQQSRAAKLDKQSTAAASNNKRTHTLASKCSACSYEPLLKSNMQRHVILSHAHCPYTYVPILCPGLCWLTHSQLILQFFVFFFFFFARWKRRKSFFYHWIDRSISCHSSFIASHFARDVQWRIESTYCANDLRSKMCAFYTAESS